MQRAKSRTDVYRHILGVWRPGMTKIELGRAANVSHALVHYYLDFLKEDGVVFREQPTRYGAERCEAIRAAYQPGISRVELAERVGLKPVTLSRTIKLLMPGEVRFKTGRRKKNG